MSFEPKSLKLGEFDVSLLSYIDVYDTDNLYFLEPLYKIKEEKKSVWHGGFNGIDFIFSIFGQVGGKLRITKRNITTNKSGRTLEEQAKLEILSNFNKKYNDGYRRVDEESDDVIEPMLADKYNEKTKLLFPIAIQPKLDGIRGLCYLDKENNVVIQSRKSKSFQSIPHLIPQIKILLEMLPDGWILDGELYNPDISFNQLSSIIRSEKKLHPEYQIVDYHIFDMIPPREKRNSMIFIKRYSELQKTYNNLTDLLPNIKIVETKIVEKDTIQQEHDYFVSNGYEGIMLRRLTKVIDSNDKKEIKSSLYHFGRCGNILKYKMFQEDEGKIIDIQECEGTEEGAAKILLELKNKKTVWGRPCGSIEFRRGLLKNKEKCIGKDATYKYQELSEYGVPRFPVIKEIRDYE